MNKNRISLISKFLSFALLFSGMPLAAFIGVVSQEVQIALDGTNFTTLATGLSGTATSATVTIPNTKAKAAIIRVVAKDAAGNIGMANSSSFKIKVSK